MGGDVSAGRFRRKRSRDGGWKMAVTGRNVSFRHFCRQRGYGVGQKIGLTGGNVYCMAFFLEWACAVEGVLSVNRAD
jgi:hypothetical protein